MDKECIKCGSCYWSMFISETEPYGSCMHPDIRPFLVERGTAACKAYEHKEVNQWQRQTKKQ